MIWKTRTLHLKICPRQCHGWWTSWINLTPRLTVWTISRKYGLPTSGWTWKNCANTCPAIRRNRPFTDGRAATRFHFIREASASCSSNRRLTHGFMTANGNHRRNWRKKLHNSLMPNETDRS
jgi:hypothetical protein